MTAAEAAAEWWAAKLAGPTRYDNGDRSPTGVLALGLGAVAAAKVDEVAVTDDQLAVFRARLVALIEAAQAGHPYGICTLGTDYDPDPDLREAAELAGISPERFPWKTNLWAYPDRVVVSDGYAAPHRLVWAEPGYTPPPCGLQAYDPVTYDPEPWKCGLPLYHEEPHDMSVPSPLCALCDRPTTAQYHDDRKGHPFTPAVGA